MKPVRKHPSRSFTLSSLFVLVAACAVLLAMSASAAGHAKGRAGAQELAVAALIGAAAVALLGVAVGLHHYRRLRGAALGGTIGFVVGLAAGPLVLVPAANFLSLLRISLAGAALVVAAGLAVRLMSGRGRKQ